MIAYITLLCAFFPSFWRDLETGPAKGTNLPGLTVYAVTGTHAGKEVDFAATEKKKTLIFAFMRSDKFDRPIARFLRQLDEELRKAGSDGYVVAVWLTDDVEKGKEYLQRVQQSLKLTQSAFTVYPGEMAGPADWAINGDCHLSVIVAHQGKIHSSHGFRSVNETDVTKVTKNLPKE